MSNPSDKEILDFLETVRNISIDPIDTREEPGDSGPRELFIPATNMTESTIRLEGKSVRDMLIKAMKKRNNYQEDSTQ